MFSQYRPDRSRAFGYLMILITRITTAHPAGSNKTKAEVSRPMLAVNIKGAAQTGLGLTWAYLKARKARGRVSQNATTETSH
jgi:hypothetical protein